ncbi:MULTISPECIES: acyltransferase family protein [unclassified Arthrobacter]|uniref:acyltransferase family protein n=1 Tax=unclassified Arthrobacter TaxID=235627 RepID=UPI001E5C2C56|nr:MULTISPECIES: acyltransferase family protein [unclassified Arthrobacter]MCC9144283.1 acyltransferase [Arthrobacter sp. zg-Y919]MDK1275508.1 acyltransferase family protein [Arthrobacter sp. zg.Y919]WIB03117.1 acyltransferase family protein [Arthrobacter sp. zg-Y919]
MRSTFPSLKSREPARPAAPGARLRPDVQGLRAVAVAVVVLDHLVGWPSGGFIGVDIFFVISGFLITGLLLREYEKTGSISFANFYRRRIKRILPASTLAIAVTLACSFLIFGQGRFMETLKDGAAAALFSANWRFSATGTNYFRANGPVSPLQHFWSLSVEEQFYFAWPAVMLLALTLVVRRGGGRHHARLGAGMVIGLVSLVSLAWAVWETQSLPTRAYFSTFSRIWELGAGAALAFTAPLCARLPARLRPVIAWLGLATMAAGLFLIDSSSAFPAPWALLPVAGAVLVILAGTGTSEHRFLLPLTNPVSGYLGNISYSLYLWHFPVIIFAGAVFVERSPLFYVGCVTAMLLASVFSFHLVEDPVRRSPWLSGGRTPAVTEVTRGTGFRRAAVAAAVTALITAAAVPFIPAQEKEIRLANVLPAGVSKETADLQEQIRTALGSTEWPELSPSLDDAMVGLEAPKEITACGGTGRLVVERCTWGDPDARHHAVVVGDSIAMTWVSPLREALGSDNDWDVTSLGTFGCTFTDLLIENPEPEVVQACEGRKSQAIAAIKELQPDVVFIANTYEPRFPAFWNRPMTPQEWQGSMDTMLQRFGGSVDRVVFLAPPPLYTDITDCYSKMAQPSYCAGTIDPQWRTFATAEMELADTVGASFVNPELWFCAEDWCPSFVGTTPTKRDLVHMTPAYQVKVAPALRAELLDQGIVDF